MTQPTASPVPVRRATRRLPIVQSLETAADLPPAWQALLLGALDRGPQDIGSVLLMERGDGRTDAEVWTRAGVLLRRVSRDRHAPDDRWTRVGAHWETAAVDGGTALVSVIMPPTAHADLVRRLHEFTPASTAAERVGHVLLSGGLTLLFLTGLALTVHMVVIGDTDHAPVDLGTAASAYGPVLMLVTVVCVAVLGESLPRHTGLARWLGIHVDPALRRPRPDLTATLGTLILAGVTIAALCLGHGRPVLGAIGLLAPVAVMLVLAGWTRSAQALRARIQPVPSATCDMYAATIGPPRVTLHRELAAPTPPLPADAPQDDHRRQLAALVHAEPRLDAPHRLGVIGAVLLARPDPGDAAGTHRARRGRALLSELPRALAGADDGELDEALGHILRVTGTPQTAEGRRARESFLTYLRDLPGAPGER